MNMQIMLINIYNLDKIQEIYPAITTTLESREKISNPIRQKIMPPPKDWKIN